MRNNCKTVLILHIIDKIFNKFMLIVICCQTISLLWIRFKSFEIRETSLFNVLPSWVHVQEGSRVVASSLAWSRVDVAIHSMISHQTAGVPPNTALLPFYRKNGTNFEIEQRQPITVVGYLKQEIHKSCSRKSLNFRILQSRVWL